MNYRLLLLSLGTFAIGTEGFMIAGILPALSKEFAVSLSTAGLLVTVFSLTYAIGSPVLATLTGQVEKRKLLSLTLLLFAIANAICGFASQYWLLLLGRIIAAVAAALFVPSATTTAASLVPPENRGRALAVVIGGQTVALAMGVPLGTWIALTFHWRMTFWIVGVISLLAAILIRLLFPVISSSVQITLGERFSYVKRPAILSALLTTVFWGVGAFTVYTYLSEVFNRLGATERMISLVLFTWGVASLIGSSIGGIAADRFGSARTIFITLSVLLLALTSLSVLTSIPQSKSALGIGFAAMAIWGISAWAFNPAQQHRVIGLSGKASGIVVSLNASAIYLGSALGSAVGGLVIAYSSVSNLGYIGGACELLAILFTWLSRRNSRID